LPGDDWLNDYLTDMESKAKAEKQKAWEAKRRKSLQLKAKGNANVERVLEERLRAKSKTSKLAEEGAGMPTIEEEEDNEEGAVAAEFQLQWDDLALSPTTWQKSKLRAAGEAMRGEIRPHLPLPVQLQGGKSNVKKMIGEPGLRGPPSRAASRAASRASRQKVLDDGKVNLALGWTTRSLASRASSTASGTAIEDKPLNPQYRRVDSPLQTKKIKGTII